MKNKNIFIVAGVTLAVTTAGLVAYVAPVAANSTNYNDLVQNIATKFGVSAADVSQVFKDTKAAKQQEMLNELVTQGKLTAEQAAKLGELQTAVHNKMDELKDSGLSMEEVKAQVEPLHEAVKTYITEQGLTDVLPAPKGGMGERGPKLDLTALVSEGKLTQTQANELTVLQDAVKAKLDTLKTSGLTREEVKTQMQPLQEAIKTYITEQGLTDVLPAPKGNQGRMGGMMGGPRGEF